MKRFLWQVSLFYLFSFLFFLTLELLARQAPNVYQAKHQYMEHPSDSLECLILGSSHTFYGLRPDLFSMPTYSLANVSQEAYYDCSLLERYHSRCPRLKYLICDLSVFTPYSERLEEGPEWYRVICYELYMGYHDHSLFSRYRYELSYLRGLKEKLKLMASQMLHPIPLTERYPGGVSDLYSLDLRPADWNDAPSAVERHLLPADSMVFEAVCAYYARIATICRERDLTLLFVTTPAVSEYWASISSENREPLRQLVERTAAVCPKTFWLDLLEDNRFVEDDFYDSDHLNYEHGAVKLTSIVNDWLTQH